jgi:hypothetical protein
VSSRIFTAGLLARPLNFFSFVDFVAMLLELRSKIPTLPFGGHCATHVFDVFEYAVLLPFLSGAMDKDPTSKPALFHFLFVLQCT